MSSKLLDTLKIYEQQGAIQQGSVILLVSKAKELTGKNEENLTDEDLINTAKSEFGDIFNVISTYLRMNKIPAQQEAPAQETAPEAPQADAKPSKTPKTSEDPPKEASEKKKEATKKPPTKKTNYHYSFSGADCDVYAYRSGVKSFTHLKTIATLSTSIYESKSPVRVLGSAGPVGYTGSIRTIAGSMVFVLTEDHPLRELLEYEDAVLDETFRKFDDTKEKGNIMLSGMAAPFNILVIYKNEVGAQLMYRLEEVEIISEGIVSSVNDMITEMVFQFVALDMKQISAKE